MGALKFLSVHWIAAVIAFVALVALIVFLPKLTRKPGHKKSMGSLGLQAASWKSYLKAQGLMVCGFLVVGGLLGGLSSFFYPVKGTITTGGKLIEYHVDLSQGPVFEDLDAEHSSGITVLAKTTAPEKGAATVIIYSDGGTSGTGEITRLESAADSWSRWDQQNPKKHISFSIRASLRPGATPATQADVRVYLTPN